MFENHSFVLWEEGSNLQNAEKDELVKKIINNGGMVRRAGFLGIDSARVKVILCSSLRHIRDQTGSIVRSRRAVALSAAYDHCVSISFVQDSVTEGLLADINRHTFDGLMSRTSKQFRLGNEVCAADHYFVRRTLSLPLMVLDKAKAPVYTILFNHSQAGKTTTLRGFMDNTPSAFKFVYCLFTEQGAHECLYSALSLASYGYGSLGPYVFRSELKKCSLFELFATSTVSDKPFVFLCDELDALSGAEDTAVFFDTLRAIQSEKEKYPLLQSFVFVGVFRSERVPISAGSNFKIGPEEVIPFQTYFDDDEILLIRDQLELETGIHVSLEICKEIKYCTQGHPGFVSFYFRCILECLKESPEQLNLSTWRRISVGDAFQATLAGTDLGIKLRKALKDQGSSSFRLQHVLKRLLTSTDGHTYNQFSDFKVVEWLEDYGLIRKDSGKIFFSCDVMWAQTMNCFCGKAVYGPTISADSMRTISMLDFLELTLPFMNAAAFATELSSKVYRNSEVPSEYCYQLEFGSEISHAGDRIYHVHHEANYALGRRRADIRILNGENWAVLELMSHAGDNEFVEHIRRTHEAYSVLNPKHLAVIQFHTDKNYKLKPYIVDEIRKLETVDVFLVIHDKAFMNLNIQNVLNSDESVQIDVRSTKAIKAQKNEGRSQHVVLRLNFSRMNFSAVSVFTPHASSV